VLLNEVAKRIVGMCEEFEAQFNAAVE
jgi:hypothetical protein